MHGLLQGRLGLFHPEWGSPSSQTVPIADTILCCMADLPLIQMEQRDTLSLFENTGNSICSVLFYLLFKIVQFGAGGIFCVPCS